MKIFSLKCVNCGAALEVKQDIDEFACGYCGVQQHVERGGGIVSLRRLEDALDDVKLGTNRAASELALSRLHADVNAICARRDSEIKALRTADEKNNSLIGWGIIIGIGLAIYAYGWWSIPVIIGGLVFGSFFIKSVKKDIRMIEARAAARIEPLKEQIARHQSIVDSYDFGTHDKP